MKANRRAPAVRTARLAKVPHGTGRKSRRDNMVEFRKAQCERHALMRASAFTCNVYGGRGKAPEPAKRQVVPTITCTPGVGHYVRVYDGKPDDPHMGREERSRYRGTFGTYGVALEYAQRFSR